MPSVNVSRHRCKPWESKLDDNAQMSCELVLLPLRRAHDSAASKELPLCWQANIRESILFWARGSKAMAGGRGVAIERRRGTQRCR